MQCTSLAIGPGNEDLAKTTLPISSAVNCSSCQQAQEYKKPVSLVLFTQSYWSATPSLAASIRYVTFSHAKGWTTSVCQRGWRRWRLFGAGSWNGWLFMRLCCFYCHLPEEKSLLDLQKLMFFFSFFCRRKNEEFSQRQPAICGSEVPMAPDNVAEVWAQIRMLGYAALFFLPPWKTYQHFITMSNGASTTGWGNKALPQSCQNFKKKELLQSAGGKAVTTSLRQLIFSKSRGQWSQWDYFRYW